MHRRFFPDARGSRLGASDVESHGGLGVKSHYHAGSRRTEPSLGRGRMISAAAESHMGGRGRTMADTSLPAKLFTVEEANRMLPLVRAITRDWIELSESVIERRERIQRLTVGREIDANDP